MKNKKISVAAGALLCTSALSAFSPILSASAFNNSADGSSYFDINAQQCIVEQYNTANPGANITSIEQIDTSKVTTLDCHNRNISNFRGVVMLTKLKDLNLSGNANLALGDSFLVPDSLETLNISGVKSNGLNISQNTNLKTLVANQDLYLTTSTYIEKLSDKSEYSYGMNLSGLKFLNSAAPVSNQTDYPAKYDSSTKIITYKDAIPNYVPVKIGSYTYYISSRGGSMQSIIYFNNGDDAASQGPIGVQDDCEENKDGSVVCNNAVYYGDTIDTEAFAKAFDLSGYTLSKVEIIPPKKFVDLTVNEDTVKKGIVLADANITIKYYFDLSDLNVPDTGAFTGTGTTVVATTAAAAIVLAGAAMYISRHATKRQKAKVHFGKK